MPHGGRVLDREYWLRRRRRFTARAISRAAGLIGASPRLRGLALRALLDRHLAPGTLCLVPFGDHALYVDPRDDKIALKLMTGRCWQRRELETAIGALRAANALRQEGVFIDVGANIGALSVYAIKSGVFAGGIAVEPDPHNFAILKRNLSVNGLDQQVHAIDAAASDAKGHLQLSRHGKNQGAHSVESTFGSPSFDCIRVAAVRLDDLLHEHAIAPEDVALVKIDVEGHELAVLEGASELRHARVPIMVELTAERRDGERLERFKRLLLPYYSRALDLNVDRPCPLADLAWRADQVDLLLY